MTCQKTKQKAFTLVELLTVISVITLIIGLLVPALNKVNKIAKDMKQKAQFHSIEVALEMFKTEQDEYPDSGMVGPTNFEICGAHRLAEALVGLDLQGYDPVYNWSAPFPPIFDGDDLGTTESLERRKSPYLNLENMAAFGVSQLYGETGTVFGGNVDIDGTVTSSGIPAPVLTDIYKATKVTVKINPGTAQERVKSLNAGTPVLYYKANASSNTFDWENLTSDDDRKKLIYNINDNDSIVKLGKIKDQNIKHKIASNYSAGGTTGPEIFYEEILTNPNITTIAEGRPYRRDSFILISAGFDGIYGTADDIYNFGD